VRARQLQPTLMTLPLAKLIVPPALQFSTKPAPLMVTAPVTLSISALPSPSVTEPLIVLVNTCEDEPRVRPPEDTDVRQQ